jgi:predicted translin family RNA/ssDNA-binding protein
MFFFFFISFCVVQVNRDVSSASKKVIFLLQRILNETSDDDRALCLRAAGEAKTKLAEAHVMLRSIAHELVGPNFWRYAHNISGGLQEYIEALSFAHYVECGGLVSYERAQANLCDDTGLPVCRTPYRRLSYRC